MKNLTLALFALWAFYAKAQEARIEIIKVCSDIKSKQYTRVAKRGLVLHITCKDYSHYFFLINEKSDSTGMLLNKDYGIKGKGLCITSSGPGFFVVKKKNSDQKYQYNFNTNSWSFDRIKPPHWSTGNREDP